MMKTMRCLICFVTIILLLGLATIVSASEINGQIVAISGPNDLYVKDKNGKKLHVQTDTKHLKVGDTISVRGGVLIKKATNDEDTGPKRILNVRPH